MSVSPCCLPLGLTKIHDIESCVFCFQNWQRLLLDGLHLSKPGSQKLAKCLVPFLDQAVGPVPAMFPDWKCIDLADPESSIATWVPDR